jgi:peptidoglycan/LPS O-acetylase OafA/YrhL
LIETALILGFRESTNPWLRYAGSALPLEFISGAAIGILYCKGTSKYSALAMAIGSTLAMVAWIGCVERTWALNVDRTLLFGLPAALIVYGMVGFEKRAWFVAPAWSVAIGDASYAIYLWHFSVIEFLHKPVGELSHHSRIGEIGAIIITAAAIGVVSFSIYNLFEKPVTKKLHSLIKRIMNQPQPPRSRLGAAGEAQ